jgi:hypothetical protein
MVNEVEKKGLTAYVCELCGSKYGDLETAERCEQYCYSHGHSSRDITQRAIKPFARFMRLEPRRRANVPKGEGHRYGGL